MRAFAVVAAFAAILAAGCGDSEKKPDGGIDAGADAGAADAGVPDAGAPDGGLKECLYEPAQIAFEKTHMVWSGTGILPSGRAITPAGNQLLVGRFPGNMIMSPDGKTIVISNNGYGGNSLVLVDTATGKIRQTVPTPDDWLLYGLAMSEDGTRLYAAGGVSKYVYKYTIDGNGTAAFALKMGNGKDGFPTGLALSKDGTKLYVANYNTNNIMVLDAETGAILQIQGAGFRPFGLALSPDGSRIYASSWGTVTFDDPPVVNIFDAASLSFIKELKVGKNPERILADPARSRLYVLNSDQETVSVIDTVSDTVTSTISLLSSPDAPTGVFPLGASLSPDGSTLYVAAAAKNSVEAVDLASLKVLGSIPAGWYPLAVEASKDGKKLFVLNGKGEGTGSNADMKYIAHKMTGTLSILDAPDAAALSDHTKKVEANNLRPMQFFGAEKCAGQNFPIPFAPGGGSPIEHVIFILKENRTFDQVFGDFEGAERDPNLCEFCDRQAGKDTWYTPNHHKLAREFVIADNFYTESEVSVQGHLWATGMEVNDFSERTWLMSYRSSDGMVAPLSGVEPSTSPLNPYLFEHLYNNGVSFIDYGQVVGMLNQPEMIFKYWDQSYPGLFFTLSVKDKTRAEYFIKRLKDGFLPRFTYMLLPCDHTEGTQKGRPTPESHVADNDEALGMIVDALSKSRFWDSSLVLVTEDDPQDGYDHVDAHRTLALLISPWTKRGHITKVHYSFASMFATFERILGLKPLNTYDANASPMFDCFTNIPDMTPYDYIPRKIPEILNTAAAVFSEESERMDFSVPDNAPGLQKVLWHHMRGKDRPYPGVEDEEN
jgi:YVTN family beta-propeller protein